MIGREAPYAVVHLVAQEANKDLIGPQVVDHMQVQATTEGPGRPTRVIVGFLESARHALTSRMRTRIQTYQRRAPETRIALLPYSSRIRRSINARYIGRRLRALAGRRPVVFHCRTETAADWAIDLSPYVGRSGIVLDVRGAWPEELLFARGFDGPSEATELLRSDYFNARDRLLHAVGRSAAVLTVSPGLVAWLQELGVSGANITYVPCCVKAVTYSADARRATRAALGLTNKLVLAYAGTVTRYQHVADGVLPFFQLAGQHVPDVHLLCLTTDEAAMWESVRRIGVPADRITVRSVAQGDMPALLSAADAGFLLRAPSRMNRFSQPTKFAEYLGAGLPVVVAKGTGVVGDLVEQHGAGIAIDWFAADAQTRRVLVEQTCCTLRVAADRFRRSALDLCDRQFLWSRYTADVRAAYHRAVATR